MANQDSGFSQEFSHHQENTAVDATARNLLAKLHLNSTTTGNHQSTVTTTAAPLFSSSSSMDPCNKCGSTKRQSPSSWSSLQEPSSKRATLLPPSSSTTTFSGDRCILGFSKLPLPATFSNASSSSSLSSPALRRTISDLINSPGASNLSDQAQISLGSLLNNQLPESSMVNPVATSPSGPLYRTISDPTSASYQVVTTTTPPRPPAARKVTWSPNAGEAGLNLKEETPNTKRLKRMKDRLREMRQWWNEVIKEGEEDSCSDSEDNDDLSKDNSEVCQVAGSEGGPCEEAVWVERNGECLILHFKCPCGKGYQILLTGKSCYYKLTAF
ncbi:unnamed protein product [Coffea canephora]|uniref:Uncharacterized protein n=1 Tax=Coffea canephora TaxID=49390 RepID=A0A068TSR2_COFCA|nr:unnamed protein product [Coffea canephora]